MACEHNPRAPYGFFTVFFQGVCMDYFLGFLNSVVLVFFVSGWIRIEHRLTRIEVLLRSAGINEGVKK